MGRWLLSHSPRKFRPATFTSTTTTATVPTAVNTAIAACENCCQMLPYLPRLTVRCDVRGYVCMHVCKIIRNRRMVAAAQTVQNTPGKLLCLHRPYRKYKENQHFCSIAQTLRNKNPSNMGGTSVQGLNLYTIERLGPGGVFTARGLEKSKKTTNFESRAK